MGQFKGNLHVIGYFKTAFWRRYFTVPFMIVLLHMRPPRVGQATLTLAMYALANVAVIYVFLFRPFVWHDGSTARFMF